MSDKVMNRDEIMRSLTTLANRLAQRGIQGEMYLVGGAAMALAYDARRVTRDINAIFVPKAEVYREAQLLAALDVVQQIYPDRKIPPRTQFFLEEVLGEYEPDPDQ